jgi:glycosyltransferase involved in cell wall biosynthesis
MYRRAGVPADRVTVMFPPIDLSRFPVSRRPADQSDFRFLWLGRIVPRKRFPLALASIELLRRTRRGARLVVIGAPGYGEVVRDYRLPSLGSAVTRQPPVAHEQVPALLARTDVILQPSENEAFGYTAAEGLACGVPTVLGPSNGTADALEDAAFRFEDYEPPSVAAAMERAMDAVLADPVGISQRARAVAERTLDLEKVAQRSAQVIADAARRWHDERGSAAGNPLIGKVINAVR